MLSYRKWKKLNENIGGTYTLGLSQRQNIADLQSRWDEMGMPMKKSKKMFGDDGGMGDEGGPPLAPKGGLLKKKKKPFGGKPVPTDDAPMDDIDPMAGDEDGPPEDDLGDDEEGGDDMGDDEEGGEDLGDDMGGDEEGGDDMGGDEEGGDDMGGDMGGDMPLPKRPKKGNFIDKTKAVADGAKLMHKGASKMIKGMKESSYREDCAKCKMANKKMAKDGMGDLTKKWASKKMTKEEYAFFNSLQNQTGGVRFEKDDAGGWVPVKEDAVIPPNDPNAGLEENEPGPGEVGYAPQGRVGAMGSFTEWSEKYKRKERKVNETNRSKGMSWFGQ